MLSKLLSHILFPATLSVALCLAYYLYTAQVFADPSLIAVVILVSAALWVWLWEQLLPYRPHWNRNDDDLQTDSIHIVVQLIITRLAMPLYVLLLFPVVSWLADTFGAEGLWPHHWPIAPQLLLSLVLAEFGRYWLHRAAHRYHGLWRFHAVHHSPNRLYWLNAGRFHPVEKLYLQFPEVLPFILLNPGEDILMLYLVTNGVHGFFQHCNVHTRIGPLNYIFSMTELHRWHHSKVIEQSDTNFGNILILWDLVFGTFYWPREKDVGSIGVMNPAYPKNYLGQLAAPFHADMDKPADYQGREEHYKQLALNEAATPERS